MTVREGQVSSREAAIEMVRNEERMEREQRAFKAKMTPDITVLECADDDLFNFLSHAGMELIVAMLRVEATAVYGAAYPPTDAELNQLWYVREVITLLKGVLDAEQLELAEYDAGKNIRRHKNHVGRAESALMDFIEQWGPYEVVDGLRLAEKRAAYLFKDDRIPDDLVALVLYREMTDRIAMYDRALEAGEMEGRVQRKSKAAKKSTRRERGTLTTSAN